MDSRALSEITVPADARQAGLKNAQAAAETETLERLLTDPTLTPAAVDRHVATLAVFVSHGNLPEPVKKLWRTATQSPKARGSKANNDEFDLSPHRSSTLQVKTEKFEEWKRVFEALGYSHEKAIELANRATEQDVNKDELPGPN